MKDIQIFNNQRFGQVRTVKIEDKVFFVAIDIARALGYRDPNSAISRHAKGLVKHPVLTNGGMQDVYVVPEGDIYRLAARSELPGAEEFESWIFDEVLPSIRKHGLYAVDDLLNDPDLAIKAFTALKEERQKRAIAEQQVAALQPKAQSYELLMDASGTLTMNEVAKLLDIKGIGKNNLFKLLTLERIIYKQGNSYYPYQSYRQHFIVKQNPIRMGEVIEERSQLFMSTKGLNWLAHKLIGLGYTVNYHKGKIA